MAYKFPLLPPHFPSVLPQKRWVTSGSEILTTVADERKVAKYANLSPAYLFVSVAVETMGAFGSRTFKRVNLETAEEKSWSY